MAKLANPSWLVKPLGVVICAFLLVNMSEAQSLPSPQPLPDSAKGAITAPQALELVDLLRLAVEQNPTLRQAEFEIAASQGRAVQAGLYPNPTVSVDGDEIGKRGGIHTLPQISQEIVTNGKRGLSRAVVEREVSQSTVALLRQRYVLFTSVRQGYYDVLSLQRRVEVLNDLEKLATQGLENAEKLFKAQQIGELDVLPFRVEANRLRADLEATQREQSAARQRLAAVIGVPKLPAAPVVGSIEAALPAYEFDKARLFILESHPEVGFARVGVERAQLAVRKEEAQVVPNVTLSGGYQRNFNDRENQAMYQVSVPLPIFNRNQGNIMAARAELGRAIQEVNRVQNDLTARLATALGQFSAAQQRAERFRTSILRDATRAYELSLTAFKGGQFEYLRVIQAQRTVAEARLEYVRILADAWKAASEVDGLLLDDPLSPSGDERPWGYCPRP
jgi:cobalt-zinc-cadmium efflux system outer membrane protein